MSHELDQLQTWLAHVKEPDLLDELHAMQDDEHAAIEAFHQELEFGTAGLRGIIGAGTNRMNVYTVGRATQGIANYLLAFSDAPSVAIGRDSRNKGDEFVRRAAEVFAANGVKVYVYPRIEPVPAVSFAIRDLGCDGGVCMTASHNPAPYNGYKAYGPDGCQIATEAAEAISAAIEPINPFTDVKTCAFDDAIADGRIEWIGEDVLDRFIDAVVGCSVAREGDPATAESLKVVYTPLNGAGVECVNRIFERIGATDVTVVPEQAEPDGDFPTCPYPNPEIREALELGIAKCREVGADLLIATDPDADRMGLAVADGDDFALLTGNETGVLLLDYVARMNAEAGDDLSRRVAVTTIVSSVMVDAIAAAYGFEVRRVLTGFKYIGGVIGELEAQGEADRFLFGYEESYGYLNGTHVRDKDAIDATMLAYQMAQYYRARGMSLADAMRALYEQHGFYLNKTLSFTFPGVEGAQRMKDLMAGLRAEPPAEVAGLAVEEVVDYASGVAGLPAANVVELRLAGANKLIVRPSGTEPKVKAYLFAKDVTRADAEALLARLEQEASALLS